MLFYLATKTTDRESQSLRIGGFVMLFYVLSQRKITSKSYVLQRAATVLAKGSKAREVGCD